MARTLLLNASHEPMKSITHHRAVNLVLEEKAELIACGAGYVSSPSVQLPFPLVIRLHKYRRVPSIRRLPLTTRGVLLRDSYRCAYCGERATTRDHVIPRARGGEDTWENCVACCTECNGFKGDRLLADIGWTLSRTPRHPQGPLAVRLSLGSRPPAGWEPYLGPADPEFARE